MIFFMTLKCLAPVHYSVEPAQYSDGTSSVLMWNQLSTQMYQFITQMYPVHYSVEPAQYSDVPVHYSVGPAQYSDVPAQYSCGKFIDIYS